MRFLGFNLIGIASYSNVSKLGRAFRGLYAGRSVSFGNTISDFGNRHRRTWKPNIQRSSLYSAILGERVKLRVSTEALRRIDKLGGLDSYILGQKIPESECARKLKENILKRKLQQDQ
jgi:ribosomal protein L28